MAARFTLTLSCLNPNFLYHLPLALHTLPLPSSLPCAPSPSRHVQLVHAYPIFPLCPHPTPHYPTHLPTHHHPTNSPPTPPHYPPPTTTPPPSHHPHPLTSPSYPTSSTSLTSLSIAGPGRPSSRLKPCTSSSKTTRGMMRGRLTLPCPPSAPPLHVPVGSPASSNWQDSDPDCKHDRKAAT